MKEMRQKKTKQKRKIKQRRKKNINTCDHK